MERELRHYFPRGVDELISEYVRERYDWLPKIIAFNVPEWPQPNKHRSRRLFRSLEGDKRWSYYKARPIDEIVAWYRKKTETSC